MSTTTTAASSPTFSSGIWKSVYVAPLQPGSAAISYVVPHVFYRGEHPVEPLVRHSPWAENNADSISQPRSTNQPAMRGYSALTHTRHHTRRVPGSAKSSWYHSALTPPRVAPCALQRFRAAGKMVLATHRLSTVCRRPCTRGATWGHPVAQYAAGHVSTSHHCLHVAVGRPRNSRCELPTSMERTQLPA